MRLISWNVNGIRACCDKGFRDSFKALDADFFCLQETKMQEGQLDLSFEGYTSFWNYAEKKGYSGTAIFTRHQPLNVTYGIGIDEHDHEGRVITLEMENFFLVTVYTPNSQDGLKRLDYRMTWEDDFRAYIKNLDSKRQQETGIGVRRPERGAQGNRPEESEDQPHERRIYRPGKREVPDSARCRFYRYFPSFLSRHGKYLLVVVISLQGSREECRVAY